MLKGKKNYVTQLFAATLFAFVLSACGGGGGGGQASGGGGSDTTPPTQPQRLDVFAPNSTSVLLSWSPSSDGIGVTGYAIYRNSVEVGTSTSNSFTDTGLAPATSYTYTVAARDAAGNFSQISSLDVATTLAAGTSALRVLVTTDDEVQAVENVTVVLGNPDGSIVSTGITGVNGEVIFLNPPANAIVTAAKSGPPPWNTNITLYDLDIYYDVNVPSISMFNEIHGTSPVATVSVNVVSSVPGVDYWSGAVYGNPGSNPAMREIWPDVIQNDGKVSYLAFGYNNVNNLIGYGFLLDQMIAGGTTVSLPIDRTDFVTSSYSLLNIPATGKQLTCGYSIDRKTAHLGGSYRNYNSTPFPSSVSMPIVPGVADAIVYDASLQLDRDLDGMTDSDIDIEKYSPLISNQTFDFSGALPFPSNFGVTNGGTDTPTFSWTWSGNPASAHGIVLGLSFPFSPGRQDDYSLHLSPGRTTARFPVLPASLAAFRPTTAGLPGLSYLQILGSSFVSNYDYWLVLMDRYRRGTFSFVGLTGTGYSATVYK